MNGLGIIRSPSRIDPLARLYALILPSLILVLDVLSRAFYDFRTQTPAEALRALAESYCATWLLVLLPMASTITAAAAHGPRRDATLSASVHGARTQRRRRRFFYHCLLSEPVARCRRLEQFVAKLAELDENGLAADHCFRTTSERSGQRRLYQIDRPGGARTLNNLLCYLDMALPQLRSDEATLAEESRLIGAYLEIHRIRMGGRLDFEIEIPDALCTRTVPSMMLLTLVENAIKHGLDPLPEGGFVRISAETVASGLRLSVADSGRGIVTSTDSGSGTGLSNIRARLSAQYGADTNLSLALNQPRGVIATLLLPSAPSAPSAAT